VSRDDGRSSFDRFVQESSGALFGQAYVLCGQYHEAQDLVQETLVRLWQHWDRVAVYEDPRGWARHVLHNLAVSRWRKARIRLGSLGREQAVEAPDIGHLDVVEALGRLPERQKRSIVLHDVVGMSVTEVAAEMGVPEGSVRGWLSRGRASLASDLSLSGAGGDVQKKT